MTLTQSATTILRGQPVRLSGKVTRAVATEPGSVDLHVRNDAGQIELLKTVPVKSDGTFTYTFNPAFNGTYSAHYTGDSVNPTAASTERRVNVACRLGADGGSTSSPVIKGSVLPDKTGQVVTLYSVDQRTGRLTKLATTRVTSGSHYYFRYKLSRGNHLLQVGIGATSGNVAGAVRFVAKRT